MVIYFAKRNGYLFGGIFGWYLYDYIFKGESVYFLIIPFLVPATQTVSSSWKAPSSPPPFVPPLRETEEASRLNFPPEIKKIINMFGAL